MFNKIKNRTFIMIAIVVMCITIPLSAQLKRDGLIFSEVYLNEDEPDKSWLEIYNPTTEPLILEKFRFYHIKTTNVLPKDVQEKDGIEVLPGECIVLCANEVKFKIDFQNDPQSKLIQVDVLTRFGKGGFFSLGTKNLGDDGVDIFRYGDPEITEKLSNEIGSFIIPLSKGDKSYKRIEGEDRGNQFQPNFIQNSPSPGFHK